MSPVKSPEELGATDVRKQDKIVVEKNEAEELPPGWIKKVKSRKTGSATKVDRFYTDPVTGYIFRSLKDVQRYLKTGEIGRLAIKPKTQETEKPTELKEQMSETLTNKRAPTDKSESPARASKRLAGITSDPLLPSPPEPKTRQATKLAGIKVDAPSPSQSLPEPKTRPATRLAVVAIHAPSSPPEPKTRQATRVVEVVVDASLPSLSPPEPKTRQATRLAEVAVDASPPFARTNHQATRQSGNKTDASVPSPLPAVPKTRQAARQAGINIDSPPPLPPASKTHQATPPTGTEIGPSPPFQPEPKTHQAKRASGVTDNASPPQPKTRRATRLAGVKIDSPPPSPPDSRTSRQVTRTRLVNSATLKANDKHNENADMDANTNRNQENSIITNEKQEPRNILPPVTPKEHNKQVEMGPATSPPRAAQPPPTVVVPSVNIQKQESPVVNPTVSNPVPQDSYSYGSDMKPESSTNFSMTDLWTDPCIEFAVKTLTGAIPFADLNKVENFTAPSEVPLKELWTDPCIEFAVKTLTGAIPVGENDYLQHRPASSANPQGPHNFSSPMNVCQTGHKNKQQDSVFPTLGNGGLQKPGKFVNGSNGQCSRSRFFQ